MSDIGLIVLIGGAAAILLYGTYTVALEQGDHVNRWWKRRQRVNRIRKRFFADDIPLRCADPDCRETSIGTAYGRDEYVEAKQCYATVVSLLGALNRNDARTAQHIINTCDPSPALFAMAVLVLSLTDQAGESVPELLETLRRQVPGAGGKP